jgi:hypothetical protein
MSFASMHNDYLDPDIHLWGEDRPENCTDCDAALPEDDENCVVLRYACLCGTCAASLIESLDARVESRDVLVAEARLVREALEAENVDLRDGLRACADALSLALDRLHSGRHVCPEIHAMYRERVLPVLRARGLLHNLEATTCA